MSIREDIEREFGPAVAETVQEEIAAYEAATADHVAAHSVFVAAYDAKKEAAAGADREAKEATLEAAGAASWAAWGTRHLASVAVYKAAKKARRLARASIGHKGKKFDIRKDIRFRFGAAIAEAVKDEISAYEAARAALDAAIDAARADRKASETAKSA
jgi:citrate lyase gamma subunit